MASKNLRSLAVALALLSAPVVADGSRMLTIHLASSHLGADGFNEENPGIGLRLGRGDWYGAAGFYKNSLSRNSVYAGAGKTLGRIGPLAFNLNGGFVTGYNVPVAPFISPEVMFDFGRARAILSYVPKVTIKDTKTEHALALSIGVSF